MPPNSTSGRLTLRLVGARRRVDRHERHVVPARQQFRRQRVVAEAAAAIHPCRAGGDREDLHDASFQAGGIQVAPEAQRSADGRQSAYRALVCLTPAVNSGPALNRTHIPGLDTLQWPSGTPARGTGSRRCCLRAAAASSTASSARGRSSAGRCAPRRAAAAGRTSLQVIARADQRRADRVEHLRLRALDDRDEREHVLLLRDGRGSGESQ